MTTWFQKLKIARRHAYRPIDVVLLASVSLTVFMLFWPSPSSLSDLEHYSGVLSEVRRPPEYSRAQLTVSTTTGPVIFMLDGARVGIPAARTLVPGNRLEIWSRKDGRWQHVWQLAADGTMLLPFERTDRFWRQARFLGVLVGIAGFGLTLGLVEYLYRKHRRLAL